MSENVRTEPAAPADPTTPEVVVVGSANLDLIRSVPAIPAPGVTVLATAVETRAGGKGLNQAVAAARAGARTAFVAAVGDDAEGDVLVGEAAAAGVDTRAVRRVPGRSGSAWIMVQADGENAIVVDAAANHTLTRLSDEESALVAAARVVVAQLEVPLDAVRDAATAARRSGAAFVLNAAPARDLPDDLLALVDVLVVNEHEAALLGGAGGAGDAPAAAEALLGRVGAVVVTLGGDGAYVADASGGRHVAGVAAAVVDTTGAGDTFTGVLAATLAAGTELESAVVRAVVAGALAVEAPGAVPSIPTAEAIAGRMREATER